MKIKDVGDVITGKTPITSESSFFNDRDIMFITPADIAKGYRVDFSDRYISENGYDSILANTLNGFSVLVGCIGSDMGNVAFVEKRCATNQQINAVTNFCKDVNPLYFYYWLSTRKAYLRAIAGGTTTPLLPKSVFEEIEVSFPLKTTQDTVAIVLSCLDEKIRLNMKICSELELQAKTIYDYWFTQFDFPDVEGKPYRTSGGEMVWNEQLKRELPKGWEAGRISDIANITMGQSPAGESYNESGNGMIFYQGSTDFGTRFPFPRVYTSAPTRFAKAGDVLMSVRAPVGTLNIALDDCCIGRGLAALNSKIGSQLYLMYTMVGFKQIFDVMDGNGTTFGSINKDTLHELKVVIPPSAHINAFEEIVQPIEQKIRICEQENRELTKLRDWLLPMLMNGQAVVK